MQRTSRLISLPHSLAINIADHGTLLKKFDASTATTIKDLRWDGFKHRSDFEERMARAGKSTENWKQGWKDILDFCDF